MRVITGTLKGRTIQQVPGPHTRPTSDKVKEAVFHVMGPYFKGGHSLDLYAGSGSLGIEALSRGMHSAIFIDRAREAVQTIRRNIRQLHLEENATVYRNNALRALDILAKKQESFDLIFIDPPYDSTEYTEVLEKIQQTSLANNRCYIYIEHAPDQQFTYDETYYHNFFKRDYSREVAVTILQVNDEAEIK